MDEKPTPKSGNYLFLIIIDTFGKTEASSAPMPPSCFISFYQ